ncbi:MAG: alpha/beta hydrolase, partial [bacterium]
VDVYASKAGGKHDIYDLLLFNDGQELIKMDIDSMVSKLGGRATRLICVGIHAGEDRKQEYGVVGFPDYMNRGSRASNYSIFILDELLPRLLNYLGIDAFREKFFAGFSLGGLMAFDLVIDNPLEFTKCGVFSGAFWWRSTPLGTDYVDDIHRIMHAKVRTKAYSSGQQFFFQVGALDELADRNNNGVIDAIDDTLDLMRELEQIGYHKENELHYHEIKDGRHDAETWGRAMPLFLDWLLR